MLLATIVIFRRREGDVEFLLVQSSDGGMGWTPPKGHLHNGEGEIDGARRETQEETSLGELTGYTFFNNSTQPIYRRDMHMAYAALYRRNFTPPTRAPC